MSNLPAGPLVWYYWTLATPLVQLQNLHRCATSCNNSKLPAAPWAGLHTPPCRPCTPAHASPLPLLCWHLAVPAVLGLTTLEQLLLSWRRQNQRYLVQPALHCLVSILSEGPNLLLFTSKSLTAKRGRILQAGHVDSKRAVCGYPWDVLS